MEYAPSYDDERSLADTLERLGGVGGGGRR